MTDGIVTDIDLSGITRVEVIDNNGRSYTNHKVVDVELQIQDDSRTLKIFLTEEIK